jgi:RsiW-degrading membrane proteinase PrsW (M82 family)
MLAAPMGEADRPVHEAIVTPGALPRRMWLVTLLVGTVLWAAVAAAILATENTILVPNLIMLGTFMVPVCTLLFVLGRPRATRLSVQGIVLGFLAGGTAGVMLTGTLEVYLLPDAVFTNTLIGLIEEAGKGLLVVAVAAVVRTRLPRDGMVLGAAVGAGFAAFESAGYALGELVVSSDRHPVLRVVETEVSRAVSEPFGHIAWTAILGGAIFASASASGRIRLDARVFWTFVGVVAVHAAWDAAYGVAIRVSLGLGGNGWRISWPNTESWPGEPSGAELWRFDIVYEALLVILALIGSVWALRRWRAYGHDRWTEGRRSEPIKR